MKESPKFPPYIALFISVVAVSTASILIRMSGAPPLAIATYRLTFTTLILLPFYIHFGGAKRLLRTKRRDLMTLVVIGIVLALHFASWITSLNFTSVASSVLFVHIDPIFVAVASHIILGEKLRKGTVLGIIVAFLGTAIIALSDSGVGETSLYGDILAIVGAIMLGLYILFGRKLRQSLDLVSYVTPVYATSALTLGLGSLATGTMLTGYPLEEYLLFLAIAIVPMIFGHTVYNWTLRYVKASIVSISLLGEPIGATILAYIFLGEKPVLLFLVGGFITLIGIYQCIRDVTNAPKEGT